MIAYRFNGGVYVNLTNRCPAACSFCVKAKWDFKFRGSDLKLHLGDPTVAQVLAALDKELTAAPAEEVVFCGFGEATYRLPEMRAAALHVKARRPKVRLRLNTIGLGSLIWGHDIAPELKRFLDAVSVSLNSADPAQWLELVRPLPRYREKGFEACRAFARSCAAAGLSTRVTAVDLPEVRPEPLEAFAREIGAAFALRPRLD